LNGGLVESGSGLVGDKITLTAVLYDIAMEHIEMHLVLRPTDVDAAWDLGLIESLDDELICEHCEEVVGSYKGQFYPYAVVINGDDEDWVICYECYWPVVNPTKSLPDD